MEEAVEEEATPVEAVDAAEARVGLVGEETAEGAGVSAAAATSESERWMASSMWWRPRHDRGGVPRDGL